MLSFLYLIFDLICTICSLLRNEFELKKRFDSRILANDFLSLVYDTEWQEDSGEIREKENLPVKAVRFGDTGTPLDEKQGRYTLGPLMCEGDDLFNNVVTFRVTDSTINLPSFDMGHSGDVYFEFKTTIENAVLFHAKVRFFVNQNLMVCILRVAECTNPIELNLIVFCRKFD